ncbi:MAG: hypothetical protein HYY57_01470 [Candidatus Omnitrophica bacterium]|nr:hypothetical protein [Candidatus Omnitrophota bacterium]
MEYLTLLKGIYYVKRRREMLKSLSYTMSIMPPSGKGTPVIWLNPQRHNVEENKGMGGKRPFYLNEKGTRRFLDWLNEQWANNRASP